MRKKNMLAVMAIAAAVMMAATACGSKDNTKTTEAKQETSAKMSNAESKDAKSDKTEETKVNENSSDEETTVEAAQKPESEAGNLSSGIFHSASGKYQITPPKDWIIDEDSDASVAAFTSPDGKDILEITYMEGNEADGDREVYPDTKEEYKELISRGEDMEFVRYDVETGSDGSQTFRYAIRNKTPQDGVRYYAVSGSYNAAAKKYIMATGTIESEDSAVEGQIEAALDSLKLK